MDMFTFWSRSTDEAEASECELEKLVTPEACIDLSGTYLRSPSGRVVTFTQDGDSGRAEWEGNSFAYTVRGATVVNNQQASQRGTISGQTGSFTIMWSHGVTYTQQSAGMPAPASIWEQIIFTELFSNMQLFSTCTAVQQIDQAEAVVLAEELPRLGPALAPPARLCKPPEEDLVPSEPAPGPLTEEPEIVEESAQGALQAQDLATCCADHPELVARMNLPDLLLDFVPHVAEHPVAGPSQALPAWEANWAEEEKPVPNPKLELAAVSREAPRPALGYHWLDKSTVETLTFPTKQDAFWHLDVHVEELRRSIAVC